MTTLHTEENGDKKTEGYKCHGRRSCYGGMEGSSGFENRKILAEYKEQKYQLNKAI